MACAYLHICSVKLMVGPDDPWTAAVSNRLAVIIGDYTQIHVNVLDDVVDTHVCIVHV